MQEQLSEQIALSHSVSLSPSVGLPPSLSHASSKRWTTRWRAGDVEGGTTWMESRNFAHRNQAGGRNSGVHTNTNIQPGSLTPGLCCSAAARN